MKRDSAERDLIEAEARLIQLRNAGAENKPEMSGEWDDAQRVMKDCEMMVDVAADDLQKLVSRIYLFSFLLEICPVFFVRTIFLPVNNLK